jgi:phenylacetate-CoA ligase
MAYYNPTVETLSVTELRDLQWRRLRKHLTATYHTNAYYRRLWDAHGAHPHKITSPEAFRALVPVLHKQDLLADQQSAPPYGERVGASPQELVGIYWTSGTSGIGQEFYGHTAFDALYYGHTWTHGLYWSGVRRGRRYFNTWPGSVGQLAGPDSFTRGLMELGAQAFHVGTLPTEEKVRKMVQWSPQHIATVPAYLQRLTVACAEAGIDPREAFPELESIMLATESYSVDWAQRMEDAWGTRLAEMYGSTQQGGGVAFTCERGVAENGEATQMHILEHLTYVEILDRETREPVGDGEEGELVLTTFSRDASTLVRFATDDKVIRRDGGTCPCGRPFASFVAGNVVRYDDMMKIKMVNVWPSAIDEALLLRPEVAEYQGRVFLADNGQEAVDVVIEYKPDVPAASRGALCAEFEQVLLQRCGVRMAVAESSEMLPRFEFKVRRWTDERKAGRSRVFYTVK